MSTLRLERVARPATSGRALLAYGYLCYADESIWVAQSPAFVAALEAALARPRVWWRGDPQPEGVIRVLDHDREAIMLCGDGLWRRPHVKASGATWAHMLDFCGMVVEAPDGEDPGVLVVASGKEDIGERP